MDPFVEGERQRAAAWKASTATLPDGARAPAQYVGQDGHPDGPERAFCLPAQYAAFNLMPDVRETGLTLFAELGIPWHHGFNGGPGNHLLSSQVQCVNALGQMVHDGDRLVRAFGESLGVGEPMPIEPGRLLTFEFIGAIDHFGEGAGKPRRRGTMCTSVDAAFLHRHVEGFVELVLIEWKYVESYRRRKPEPEKDETRRQRYLAFVDAADGPVDRDELPFECLLDEPFYQLVRQQLLASELERVCELGAERVRIVHVSTPGNTGYQHSLHRPEVKTLGSTVSEVWSALLRHQDRFVSFDSAAFLDPLVTSEEYVARYGPGVHS